MCPETVDQNHSQAIEVARCGSVLAETLSLAFYPPNPDSLAVLIADKTREAVCQAALFLIEHGLDLVGSSSCSPKKENSSIDSHERDDYTLDTLMLTESWVKELSSLELNFLQNAHGRLFGHTAQGAISLYETEYGQDGLFQQPQQLASLVGLYEVFGLTPRQSERERPDHISCELEFLAFLLLKKAYAMEQKNNRMLTATHNAVQVFLKEHLGRFGRAFSRDLKKHDSEGFLGKSGDFLFDYLTLQCRQFGIEAGPSQLPFRSFEEDQIPMACAGEDDSSPFVAPTELVELES